MHLCKVLVLAALVVVGSQTLNAQQDPQPKRKSLAGTFVVKSVSSAGSQDGVFFSDVGFEGNPVKNSPFSAEAVNENIAVLADGNRIIKSSTTKIYRDSEGRTRRETVAGSLPMGITISIVTPFGPTATPGSATTSQAQIQISDPVAGVNYVLDPETRTANKFTTFPPDQKVAALIDRATQESAASGKAVTIREGNAVISINTNPGPPMMFSMESLGTKMIEGVECDGTRSSPTIPAGQIGNERPIVITTEHWYSRKLQAEVLVKRNDPRSGENTYKLINIDQSEPPAALFQVPADYTVVDIAEKAKESMKVIEIKRK